MTTPKDASNDPSRLAVAVFIVATTLTIIAADFPLPTVLALPVATLLLGLIISAVFAFLYILAKGYELRYSKKKDNLIDRYNYTLYNLAMTAYVIFIGLVLVSFLHKILSDSSKEGNLWATAGITLLYLSIIIFINRKDFKELAAFIKDIFVEKLAKKRKDDQPN